MPVKVTVTKTLEDWWATDEQFAEMSDLEILELVKEDLSSLIDGAGWAIERMP